METPLLSVIIAFYRMQRESSRTLHSLTSKYQRGIKSCDYEVIAVENPSDAMLSKDHVESFGSNFRLETMQTPALSPARAINWAVSQARGEYVMVLVDGARILSPGMLQLTLMAAKLHPNPVVAALAWHLGPKQQQQSIPEGYSFEVEDRLLADSGWQEDGYRLFDISSLAASCKGGWTGPLAESNCLTLKKTTFQELGGYSTEFVTRGGGFVNLDLYERAVSIKSRQVFILLGEGSFHQMHGGVASGRKDNSIIDEMRTEYEQIRGKPYQVAQPATPPIYLGTIPQNAKRFLDTEGCVHSSSAGKGIRIPVLAKVRREIRRVYVQSQAFGRRFTRAA